MEAAIGIGAVFCNGLSVKAKVKRFSDTAIQFRDKWARFNRPNVRRTISWQATIIGQILDMLRKSILAYFDSHWGTSRPELQSIFETSCANMIKFSDPGHLQLYRGKMSLF